MCRERIIEMRADTLGQPLCGAVPGGLGGLCLGEGQGPCKARSRDLQRSAETADPSPQPATMRQGHSYDWRGLTVIALQNGAEGMVGVVLDGWFSDRRYVRAKDLIALPMKYYGGRIP